MASNILLPRAELSCSIKDDIWNHNLVSNLPPVSTSLDEKANPTRRSFLAAAAYFIATETAQAQSQGPLIFSANNENHSNEGSNNEVGSEQPSRLGEIPRDFWLRPRELWIRRQDTKEEAKVVYWKEGKIVPEGYWKLCALLRDAHANVMTTIDPGMLDVLRGILGYYHAWNWLQPIVVTSGYRTIATNKALAKEGAAKNSMHLYGKAVDLYIAGIPTKDIALLGLYLRRGGVGFYPSRGFTHLDTGAKRLWRG